MKSLPLTNLIHSDVAGSPERMKGGKEEDNL